MTRYEMTTTTRGRLLLAILFGLLFTTLLVLASKLNAYFPWKYDRLVYAVVGTVLAFLLTYAFLKWEKQDFPWIGMALKPNTFTHFVMGVIIGLISAIAVMSFVSGYVHVVLVRNPDFQPVSFFLGCIIILLMALMEEVGFRGYPLYTLNRKSGVWTAQIVMAVLFAIYHVANGCTLQNAVVGTGSLALIYGIVAIRTGGIAMSTGLHFAANLVQSSVGRGSFPILAMRKKGGDIPAMLDEIKYAGTLSQLIILFIGIGLTVAYARKKG